MNYRQLSRRLLEQDMSRCPILALQSVNCRVHRLQGPFRATVPVWILPKALHLGTAYRNFQTVAAADFTQWPCPRGPQALREPRLLDGQAISNCEG